MQAGTLDIDLSYRNYIYAFSILLLLSSIVIADPPSQIDLPDDFIGLSTDTVFERGNKLNKAEVDNEWRKPKKDSNESNVRWGAKSIYEDNEDYDPFFSNSEKSRGLTEIPETTRQIQIKF